MTDRAARKRRTTTTMPPVEPSPQKPAVNEGAPRAGHPGLVSPVAARMAAEGEPAKAPSPLAMVEGLHALAGMPKSPNDPDIKGGDLVRFGQDVAGYAGSVRRVELPHGQAAGSVCPMSAPIPTPGDSAPYQLPDGTWEVLTLDADGRVTARRTVEGPK